MGWSPLKEDESELSRYLRSGRDEMNLLEHSISGADTKPDLDTRSLSFERISKHPITREDVRRAWDVTFSAKYGRPTPKDDDVFVALMKLSQAAGLMNVKAGRTPSPKVDFSSYQLIKILGWDEGGASYRAVDDALRRLGGVYVVAENYWWDSEAEEYADRRFHIIDDQLIYERDKYDKALRRAREEGKSKPHSWIKWSDVMLESFQNGYVRKLDIEVYRSLKHPTARKLFRYLGKQFYHKAKHPIELRKLCHEKLGYKESETRTARLKQKLEPAIRELEEKGIYGLRHEFKQSYGSCNVVFFKTERRERKSKEPSNPLIEQLTAIGISKRQAEGFVSQHEPQRIIEDIEDSKYREKHGQVRTSRAGLLCRMLEAGEPWGRPEGFVSSFQRKKSELAVQERKKAEAEAQAKREEAAAKQRKEKEDAFQGFLKSLGNKKAREEFGKKALLSGTIFKNMILKCEKEGDLERANEYRTIAMMTYWEKEENC